MSNFIRLKVEKSSPEMQLLSVEFIFENNVSANRITSLLIFKKSG